MESKLLNPYEHLGYYSDDAVLVSGSSILYVASGAEAAVVADASGGGIDVDGDWTTDGSGVVSWSMTIVYAHTHGSYYSSDATLQDGVSILYNGQGTGATVAANVAPFYVVFGVGYIVNTDASGVVT